MRHHNVVRKFGRRSGQRRQLLRSLAANLIAHGKITITEARAKELRPYVEKLVTIGKAGTLASKKIIISRIGSVSAAKEVVDNLSKKYMGRRGGYARIIKLGRRQGDASPMAIIEFV